MSKTPKAFFGFLVFIMLASFAISCQSIARLHQHNEWSGLYDQEEYPNGHSWFANLTVSTVRSLDSVAGKIICMALIIVVTFGCGKLAFQHDYLFIGLFVLFVFAAYLFWIAIKLRFFDPFTPMIRM